MVPVGRKSPPMRKLSKAGSFSDCFAAGFQPLEKTGRKFPIFGKSRRAEAGKDRTGSI
jgi:hypothetical protein